MESHPHSHGVISARENHRRRDLVILATRRDEYFKCLVYMLIFRLDLVEIVLDSVADIGQIMP